MPHQCTNCGRTFPDGSKEMLSGCPDCGGNKFQFEPAGSTADDQPADTEPSTDDAVDSPPGAANSPPDASTGESVTIDPEPADNASADRQTSPPETEGYEGDADADSEQPAASGESPAQSTARSDVVDSSELTAAGAMGPSTESAEEASGEQPSAEQSPTPEQSTPTAEQPAVAGDTPTEPSAADQSTPDEEQSNLHQLRKELNDQFESIRIVSPGQYELNLMELYDREEYIISLREDGRYVIEVPDSWGDG